MKLFYSIIFMLLMFSSVGCLSPRGNSSTVIYGADDRTDFYQIRDEDVMNNARAVCSLWDQESVKDCGVYSELLTIPFSKAYGLTPKEPYYNQPVGAFCSGFLVAQDIVVTAGHCLNTTNYKEKRIVFGYRMLGENIPVTKIYNEDIYKIKRVIAHKLSYNKMDYAIVQLDRPVRANIHPVKLAKHNAKVGDMLYVIGHPAGLPLKYAPNGRVTATYDIYTQARLDTYGGNSGSAVFNDDNEVVGILVRGDTDFVGSYGDRRSNRLPENGYGGEGITNVSAWREFVENNKSIDEKSTYNENIGLNKDIPDCQSCKKMTPFEESLNERARIANQRY
jgi:hypothetical protein